MKKTYFSSKAQHAIATRIINKHSSEVLNIFKCLKKVCEYESGLEISLMMKGYIQIALSWMGNLWK